MYYILRIDKTCIFIYLINYLIIIIIKYIGIKLCKARNFLHKLEKNLWEIYIISILYHLLI